MDLRQQLSRELDREIRLIENWPRELETYLATLPVEEVEGFLIRSETREADLKRRETHPLPKGGFSKKQEMAFGVLDRVRILRRAIPELYWHSPESSANTERPPRRGGCGQNR